jgi:hypothetical protein
VLGLELSGSPEFFFGRPSALYFLAMLGGIRAERQAGFFFRPSIVAMVLLSKVVSSCHA